MLQLKGQPKGGHASIIWQNHTSVFIASIQNTLQLNDFMNVILLQVFVICAQKEEMKQDESYDPENPLIITLHLNFTLFKKVFHFLFCLKSNDNMRNGFPN